MAKVISQELIERIEVDVVIPALQTRRSGDPKQRLELTGIEVLAFLATKVALPIFCAFVKDALYEQYKALRKRDIPRVQGQLLSANAAPVLQVPRARVIEDLSGVLRSEGIPDDIAKACVERTLDETERAVQTAARAAAKE